MKYALFEGKRIEAQKGLRAVCPYCGDEVIAKCGSVKMHHWAHTTELNCDKWKENELPWHRNWKNQFPVEWQEQIFFDKQNGEKHIADVCTEHNFVIEFQHSPISEEEKQSREQFYKNMCWLIDGSGVRFRKRFFDKGQTRFFMKINGFDFFFIDNPKDSIPILWTNRDVFVFIDFKGASDEIKFEKIWCLVPTSIKTNNTLAIQFQRQDFVEMVKSNYLPVFLMNLKNDLNRTLLKRFR